ncbi:anaerobic ribonucleoside-triphosphate reductase activating protein [Rhodopseudomonas palustris]|uniref:Anaerobic ribonucleoside-triphosphate reductase activating protein n=1 Tax=Thiospirillum jenense TaxID=1653858 RepID=A0A839HKP1_9GAMM|nr:anaerobic ribonucleoside-triphosphate reductase activating protein [Thiospirillum jenense]MBB1093755.1 anaerobic ribonucleoside-triphosphate reductase activating protein [Rhodopseudomonas palustris]MBB1127238.1 anaerobic ribonucleoside-triphosphate reductase activating protein [Thiospirillum jenense]
MITTASRFLRIGGFTPLTTTDYPGELAAVVFCHGCPWRCSYCHNSHLLSPIGHANLIRWDRILTFLDTRRGLLDGVVFSGGEPTVQQALPDALNTVRACGFKTGLHTSGAYPQRLQHLLPLLDWVGLDIKALPDDYPMITGVSNSGTKAWQSLSLLLKHGINLEVRTTLMPGLDNQTYLERLMQRLAAIGVKNYVLQQCQFKHAYSQKLHNQTLVDPNACLPSNIPFEHFQVRLV